MQVQIKREGSRFWHENCANHLGGIMKEIKRDEGGSLIQCQHCKQCGYYPVGGIGSISAAPQPDPFEIKRENWPYFPPSI